MNKPLIVIPSGDPAGIGPEILVNACADSGVQKTARCAAVGDSRIIRQALAITGSTLKLNIIKNPAEGNYAKGILNLIALENIDMSRFKFGEVSGMCGKAAYEYIAKSIELAMSGQADAVATTPINKEALKQGNINFIGHTEIFAGLTGTADPLTMFEVSGLRIFFLSRHVSLRKACDMVTKDRIVDYVRRSVAVLEKLGVTGGTMAIAGLNPHSGEHGLFGDEEVNEVFPAVAALKAEGYSVEGPIGADSVFSRALQGRYNSVLSLYHDQGHVAAKTFDFERTVSVTGGMPILRTSVDHGTAFDIAGKNIAGAVSMIEAILLAAKYSPGYARR
jgi:4-hydroxythreonine-4-phosphate dehydrogenase